MQRIGAALLILLILGAAVYRAIKPAQHQNINKSALQGTPSLPPQTALQRYGFYLTQCAAQCGIHFVHQAPKLDPRLNNVMPDVASMGASVTAVDYNHSGWPSIFVTNSAEGSQCALYRNNGNGTFTNVTSQVGLQNLNAPGTGVCMGAVWGDYDNSGYPSLLVYKWGQCMLFHNDGGSHFTNVTASAGLPQHANINSAMWFDFNGDGKLYLLLNGYYPSHVNLMHLANTRMMPASFEFANNGGRKYLLENMGGGRFQDVTRQMGINSHAWTLACLAVPGADPRYPDIFLCND